MGDFANSNEGKDFVRDDLLPDGGTAAPEADPGARAPKREVPFGEEPGGLGKGRETRR